MSLGFSLLSLRSLHSLPSAGIVSPGGRYLFGSRWIPLDPFHLDGGNSFLSEWTLMLDLNFVLWLC